MTRFYKSLAWTAGVLAVIVLLYGWIAAKRALLVAHENLIVDSYPIPDPTRFPSVGKIELGEKVQVLSCDDLKSYSAIHVRLKGGREGYVIKGEFTLDLSPFWSAVDSPISFSCPPAWH
ncbi:hypothetical protein NUH87_28660 [Pseudomonas batumici]|uniref:hypothetical protein n=1 Tax=Pseudomonas batumici TaxID=226910 RepID=UPI0030CF9DDC